MPQPQGGPPLGLRLANTAKAVSQAFDDALSAAGGSRPTWLVLMSLKARPVSNQRELASAVGIKGATLTQHLNAMERDGLLNRRRDPNNRRVHLVELTGSGDAAFLRMREAAATFDRRLRTGLADDDIATLERLLSHLHDNVADHPENHARRDPRE
ncbi:MarR family winged helix-turn-helix transcriptional regulator [Prauserella alba]|uniref:MarR family winged helix-turn-helix transcriptional regulator n=1 Tax=Prauserella alba TaxID=176898 RepID=A0ABP4FN87_9PSEU|nr:MarR family winged helix-turn-helix transcriptional regulator [Prauserella alba]MCP2180267.1 MarR family transcriptional regulator, transcriptional regulator for hemolysin [Prauserella alba]